MKLTYKDITTWNPDRGYNYNFSIKKINHTKFNDDDVCLIEYYLSDNKNIFADQFNIEYMGFLTGRVNCSQKQLIDYLNEYFIIKK